MIYYNCDGCKKQNINGNLKITISYAVDDICPSSREYHFCRDCYVENRDQLLNRQWKDSDLLEAIMDATFIIKSFLPSKYIQDRAENWLEKYGKDRD